MVGGGSRGRCGASLEAGHRSGAEAGEGADRGVVGIVGGGEDHGEGEDVEGVGQDGGGGFGGQASGPLGGIQAVEELDAAGACSKGLKAAGAEQGGVAGSAEGPQAPAALLEGCGCCG